jgi:hypothetical protein
MRRREPLAAVCCTEKEIRLAREYEHASIMKKDGFSLWKG